MAAVSAVSAADIPVSGSGPFEAVALQPTRDPGLFRTEVTVDLVRGKEYAFPGRILSVNAADGLGSILTGTIEVVLPSGAVAKRFTIDDESITGTEFKATVSGTHRLRASSRTRGTIAVKALPDCSFTRATTCSLKAGVPQDRQFAWAGDKDAFRIEAVAGKTYTVTVTSEDGMAGLDVLDPRGQVVARGTIGNGPAYRVTFRPRVSGPYLFRATGNGDDTGHPYRVALSVR
jgi:hypothetical protein